MKKNTKNIFLWVLTGFMAISALVYFPSIASIIMLLFSFISAPIKQIQDFWRSKKLSGITKGILLTVLFFVSIGLVPSTKDDVDTSDNPQNISANAPQRNSVKEESNNSAITVKSDVTNEPDIDTTKDQPLRSPDNVDTVQEPAKEDQEGQEKEQPAVEPEENQPPESGSTPTTHPEPDSQKETDQSNGGGNGENFNTYDNEDQQSTKDSYVLNTNTMKIHYPSCNSVKKIAPDNYSTSSLSESELIAKGYTTCGVCH